MTRQHLTKQVYQKLGTQAMLDNVRFNCWAKPGMGKTVMAASMLDCLKLAGSKFLPAIVFAPYRVADIVWSAELQKWDEFEGLTYTKLVGDAADRIDGLLGPKTDLYIINYENVLTLRKYLGNKWPFRTVIADESRRLSGFRLRKGTLRADALADISGHVGRWYNMTGTPAPGGYGDLWGPQWFIDEGRRLGHSWTKYLQMYFREDKYTRRLEALPGAEDQINAKLADCTIAFRPEDWFDIEKPRCSVVEAVMPKKVMQQYREMERHSTIKIETEQVIAHNNGVLAGKLMQMASGSLYPEPGKPPIELHDAKNEALESIIKELGENLLVAYWWKFTPARIKRAFPHARVLSTEKDFKDWNAGRIPLALINYGSAAHGLSLQDGGRAVCDYDQIWDEELREQVLERLGPARQAQSGYKRIVLQYDIVTRGTEDEAAMIRSAEKCSIQEALMRAHARRQ
jgi:hypothetical protein